MANFVNLSFEGLIDFFNSMAVNIAPKRTYAVDIAVALSIY